MLDDDRQGEVGQGIDADAGLAGQGLLNPGEDSPLLEGPEQAPVIGEALVGGCGVIGKGEVRVLQRAQRVQGIALRRVQQPLGRNEDAGEHVVEIAPLDHARAGRHPYLEHVAQVQVPPRRAVLAGHRGDAEAGIVDGAEGRLVPAPAPQVFGHAPLPGLGRQVALDPPLFFISEEVHTDLPLVLFSRLS